ncbi:hypothetical protein N9J24_02945 [Bacteroidia bacterium]|nr:hypothetical protein [Bacteroidia bacterium]
MWLTSESLNTILNLTLAAIMFGLGLSLTKRDLHQLLASPKALMIGLLGQMILLPLIAWVVVQYSSFSLELKMGIMILSICPGGITSNLVSYFLRANVALGISLTVLNAVISVFSIPFLILLFSQGIGLPPQSVQFSFWHTLVEIFYITVLPTFLGFYFRRLFNMAGFVINKYLNRILPLLLVLIFGIKFFAGAVYGGSNISLSVILSLAPWMIVLNIVSMAAGFFFGRVSKLNDRNTLTCTIEIGLHNTALALIIAGEKIGNKTMEQPALVYALFSFIITLGIGFILSRWFPFKPGEN